MKVAGLIEFVALDLDMFIAVRTAPNQSYNNPEERIMSLLNLALQNTAYEREAMTDPVLESRMKQLTSVKAIRRAAERTPTLKEKYLESMKKNWKT